MSRNPRVGISWEPESRLEGAAGEPSPQFVLPDDVERGGLRPTLSMLPTVAVTDALISLFSHVVPTDRSAEIPTPWIKWINDVRLNHSKILGSLVATQVDGEQITSFVLGIGLNVGAAPALADDGWAGQGIDVAQPTVFRELLKTLAVRIREMRDRAGRATIYRAYQERLGGVGS